MADGALVRKVHETALRLWKSSPFATTKRIHSFAIVLTVLISSHSVIIQRQKRISLQRYLVLTTFWPFSLLSIGVRYLRRLRSRYHLQAFSRSIATAGVLETQFPELDIFKEVVDQLESSGLRSTASKAHEAFMDWIKDKLEQIPGIEITSDDYAVLRWQTTNGQSLKDAGSLTVHDRSSRVKIDTAGAIPYSKPTTGQSGQLIYVPRTQLLSSSKFANKIIIRELPDVALPMAVARLAAHSTTPDLDIGLYDQYQRPSYWEHPIHNDLIDAGKAGAGGVVFVIDLPLSQVESYWDPHQGTHYHVPAVFCASEVIPSLKAAATRGAQASIVIDAEISKATTSNFFATLPGQIEETVVYATHTDGNTCVQDNGVAALLALAQYFAKQPQSSRYRTIQFAFNTAYLHVSKEGSGVHAAQLDAALERDGRLALVIPVEHLGTRELEAHPNPNGKGQILEYSGRGELMIWCVGPSPPLVVAVEDAVKRRKLDRVMVTRGVGKPSRSKVPEYNSFGGLGTLYHNCLVPKTSIISGPWSLFAPAFGKGAVDLDRIRRQTMALGDVYHAVEGLTREEIAGGYLRYRQRREELGKKVYDGFEYPPETLS